MEDRSCRSGRYRALSALVTVTFLIVGYAFEIKAIIDGNVIVNTVIASMCLLIAIIVLASLSLQSKTFKCELKSMLLHPMAASLVAAVFFLINPDRPSAPFICLTFALFWGTWLICGFVLPLGVRMGNAIERQWPHLA